MVAVQIYELRIKAISRVTARWHLEAFVYDRSGNILARRATQGFEPIGRVGLNDNGTDIAMREIILRLSELLDEPVISRALN
jgi:YD repeat-containing protein